MESHDAIIYELNGELSYIQRARQDQTRDDTVSENTALTAKLPLNADLAELGAAVLLALNNYDKVVSPYWPWDLKELRKQICDWVGVRAWATLLKSTRIVLLEKNFKKNKIVLTPFDNCNLFSYEEMLTKKAISLPFDVAPELLGKAVVDAFQIATYHPLRKIPK